jgi:plastocyanin/heme-degrading monooxygenase HmoA
MEYVHTVLAQVAANKASDAEKLFSELESHRAVASTMRGFRGMRINRTAHPEGNVQVVVETRWSNNNDMVDYGSARENALSIIEAHQELLVAGSVETHRMQSEGGDTVESSPRFYDRLALALFVPIGVLAFSLVAIYGLSRIYLALPTAGASIMAILVALIILLLSFYFASNPRIPRWQWLGVTVVGVLALGIGGTIAAIYDEEHKEVHGSEPTASPPPSGTPIAPGAPLISMGDNFFDQTSLTIPAGQETEIEVRNNGAAIHNVQVAVDGSYSSGVCRAGSPGCSDPPSIRAGQSGTLTLNLPAGTYDYRCDFHIEEMVGVLTVQ